MRVATTIILAFISFTLSAQNSWLKKTSFAQKRERAIGFAIGDFGYLGMGEDTANNVHNDLWQYDPVLDTWTQVASLPGSVRRNAVAFTIGTKAYVGTGIDAAESFTGLELKDFWEYDPAINSWTQKADYPGGSGNGVYFATGFAVDSKGFICCGKRGPSNYANDLWEYKPSNNQWIQRANFPGGTRYQNCSFVIGQIAYIGLGTDENWYMDDFWSYNPGTNVWTQKNDFPGVARASASTFTIGSRGFVSCGSDGGFLDDLWEYNPATDSWAIRADYPGGARRNAVSFTIGDSAYLGTGKGASGLRMNFHRYHALTPVGFEENSGDRKLNIYPNPMIESAQAEAIHCDAKYYVISDLKGRMIRYEILSSETFTIHRENLPAGIYLVTIYTSEKIPVITQRLIIQ
jgi:N-acetylneuraminic acid mutarotase